MSVSERRLNAGDVLFREGDEPDGAYIVRSGILEAFHTRTDEDLIFAVFRTGDMFGEVAVISSRPRSLTVHAVEDSVLDFVPRDDFIRSFGGENNVALPLLKLLTQRLRHATALAQGDTPMQRRHKNKKAAVEIRVRMKPGNVRVANHIGDNPVEIAGFPYAIGSHDREKTDLKNDGLTLGREAAGIVMPQHAVLHIKEDHLHLLQRAASAVTYVNGEKLSADNGHTEAPLHVGLNVVVLGGETSPWRLLFEVKT